ncbi:MAG: hypothetical protein C5B59_15910 [Bacteroidetes bacterium]|nr:MAG: hypothetical protein C5B59_15910 [Bacteroidota bacterium]
MAEEQFIYEEICRAIRSRSAKSLSPLLEESHVIYSEKGTSRIFRIRAQLLNAMKETGVDQNELPYILEEFQNTSHPLLIWAAARALRGQRKPDPAVLPVLLKAFKSLSHGDDFFSVDLPISSEEAEKTTAAAEIIKTLRFYGSLASGPLKELQKLLDEGSLSLNARDRITLAEAVAFVEKKAPTNISDCCNRDNSFGSQKLFRRPGNLKLQLGHIELQDQSGNVVKYSDFFVGKPTACVFFYTRCDNPAKCSLTITRLAQLQKLLRERGLHKLVRTAAISYDAHFDLPYRLNNYCRSRGMYLDEDNRSFRVTQKFELLREYLRLGVNYIGTIVNRHRVEVYLIDQYGHPRWASTRLHWDQEQIINQISKLLDRKKRSDFQSYFKGFVHNILSALIFLGIAFFPKCPLCWAVYLSAFGISGAQARILQPWLLPFIIASIILYLWILWKSCSSKKLWLPLYFGGSGVSLVILFSFIQQWRAGMGAGLALILAGSMLHSFQKFAFKSTREGAEAH